MVCYFCRLLKLSACDGRLALVLGISLVSLLDGKTRVWMLVEFAGGVLNTPRETQWVILT